MVQTKTERLIDLLDAGTNNKKENNIMDLANVKVIIGNKAYTPNYVDWVQDPFSDPHMKLDVTVSPGTRITHRTIPENEPLSITNVIFNPPATIVFWSDKTKTVVKCDEDDDWYDPEKGLAMAISRKMLGDNKRDYYNTFLHWLKKWDKQVEAAVPSFDLNSFVEAMRSMPQF